MTPVPLPASHLLSSKPPYQGDSFLLHMCDVSESASERWRHADSQPAVFFPWQQQQHASILVPQQGYPGNRLLILRLWAPWRRELGGNHCGDITQPGSAQVRRIQVGLEGVGESFLSLALCHFSSSRLAPSATSISYLLSLA